MSECFLYWIHLPHHNDITKEGYVGISCNPTYRFTQHKANTRYNHHRQNKEFKEALVSNMCTQEILLKSTVGYCLEIERKLRPITNIGWNLAIGGDGGSVYKHGLTGSKVKRDYYNMLTRCSEKGLSVCNEWLGEEGLVNFNEFMKGKSCNLSLPKSGIVSPHTVEFLNRKDLMRKVRGNKILHNGGLYSTEELGELYNIKPNTITTRLRRGWSLDEALRGNRNEKS